MAIRAEYLGMGLTVDDLRCREPRIFRIAASTIFICRLRSMQQAALPTDHCLPVVRPRSESTWKKGRREGTVHSYSEVHHAIQPAFRGKTPYLILLVRSRHGKKGRSRPPTKGLASSSQPRDPPTANWPARPGASRRHRTRVSMVFQRRGTRSRPAAMDDDETASAACQVWRYPQE